MKIVQADPLYQRQVKMAFVKPAEKVSLEWAEVASHPFQPSSRILALLNKTSKSIGASCNVFKLEDTMRSIAESREWAMMVQAYQGAPSIDFSALRPKGTVLKSGGTSSGAVAFMKGYDADLSVIRREEKKNSSGIGYLDAVHPELEDFLALRTEVMYKGVYIPQPGTPEAEAFLANEKLIDLLVSSYDYFKCFLVKRPEGGMLANLCTEVVIPHRGFCILGAVNLSAFSSYNLFKLPGVFVDAVRQMYAYTNLSLKAAVDTEVLDCRDSRNRQFGLGVFGLSSLLGDIGATYGDLARQFKRIFDEAGEGASIHQLTRAAYKKTKDDPDNLNFFVYQIIAAYNAATRWLHQEAPEIRAAFCIQPTVSTAQRSFDHYGYHTSPEIQPVRGLHTDESTRTIIKSQIKGDKIIDYAPHTWTLEEVPYADYAAVSGYFQLLMDSTGLGHRHSHCWYGEKFTKEDFLNFYFSPIQNLYYRLPYQVNNEAVNKTKLWQTIDEGEITGEDVDLDALFDEPQVHCGVQQFTGEANCDCQG